MMYFENTLLDITFACSYHLLMKLPQTNPRDDPSALWALQMELLSIAESSRRDLSKKVYQPQFNDDVPQILQTRTGPSSS